MTLRTRDPTRIQKMFSDLQREAKMLLDDIITIIYFMRGAVSYTEAMHMSYAERQSIESFIEKRLETQKKNLHPVY